MAFNYVVDAIQLIDPKAQFIIEGNDYSTIKWDNLTGDAPTQSEIDAAIEKVKANEKAAAIKAEADKAALLAKLGITADEAKLLLN
jgi:hypothetical protein